MSKALFIFRSKGTTSDGVRDYQFLKSISYDGGEERKLALDSIRKIVREDTYDQSFKETDFIVIDGTNLPVKFYASATIGGE